MEEARIELGGIIEDTEFRTPSIPIYQCVDAKPHINPREIKDNLIQHITHPVLWTQMVHNMVGNGVSDFYEVGTDDTLEKLWQECILISMFNHYWILVLIKVR